MSLHCFWHLEQFSESKCCAQLWQIVLIHNEVRLVSSKHCKSYNSLEKTVKKHFLCVEGFAACVGDDREGGKEGNNS